VKLKSAMRKKLLLQHPVSKIKVHCHEFFSKDLKVLEVESLEIKSQMVLAYRGKLIIILKLII